MPDRDVVEDDDAAEDEDTSVAPAAARRSGERDPVADDHLGGQLDEDELGDDLTLDDAGAEAPERNGRRAALTAGDRVEIFERAPGDDDFDEYDDDLDGSAEEVEVDDLFESAAPAPADSVPHAPEPRLVRPTWRQRRAARRLRARKVGRIVRYVDPWSVLKVSLLFYLCMFLIVLLAGVILWSVAVNAGSVTSIESFIEDILSFETFEFDADRIFRASVFGGLVMVVAGTTFNVLLAVLFNLISDLTGGIRFTVVEEETARPVSSLPKGRTVAPPGRPMRDGIGRSASMLGERIRGVARSR
ncbi:MAG: DUF3566 domain-containing protein [Actinomycetota bacterium]|nr:DUF3566 domain-containing protein [Actinomycetota bacterium]